MIDNFTAIFDKIWKEKKIHEYFRFFYQQLITVNKLLLKAEGPDLILNLIPSHKTISFCKITHTSIAL